MRDQEKTGFWNFVDLVKQYVFKRYLRFILGSFVTLSVAGLAMYHFKMLTSPADLISYFGFTATSMTVIFAGFQIRAEHDWNRRHAAMIAAYEIKKQLREDTLILDPPFNIIRRKPTDTIKVTCIHNNICKKGTNGKLERDEEDKLVIDHENKAGEIRNSIINTLNESEYIAAGVIDGVFDEDIIYKLTAGIIINNYYIFKEYIDHLNNDMFPDRKGKIYENLKYLAVKFKSKEDASTPKIKERGPAA